MNWRKAPRNYFAILPAKKDIVVVIEEFTIKKNGWQRKPFAFS